MTIHMFKKLKVAFNSPKKKKKKTKKKKITLEKQYNIVLFHFFTASTIARKQDLCTVIE